MSADIDIEFIGSSLVKLEKTEKVYPWVSLGEAPRLGSIFKNESGILVLHESYQSGWQTLFGILTGGIASALFGACFHRDQYERYDSSNILKLIRVFRSAPNTFLWAKELVVDPPKEEIVYHLFTYTPEGKVVVHVFKLAYKNWLTTREAYEDAQRGLDALVLSVVPPESIVDQREKSRV